MLNLHLGSGPTVSLWRSYDLYAQDSFYSNLERLNTSSLGLNNFILSTSNELMGCLINKVASSSLVFTFLSLKGVNTEAVASPHSRLHLILPKVSLAI